MSPCDPGGATQVDAAAGGRTLAWPTGSPTGDLSALAQDFDWGGAALGPLSAWPPSLRIVSDAILRSPTAMAILWGHAGVVIYNEACRALLGRRHPGVLAASGRRSWPEMDQLLAAGLAASEEGRCLSLKGRRFAADACSGCEDVWLDLDFSPIDDERGVRAGVLAVIVDQTQRVRAEIELRELNATLEARVAERTEAVASALQTLNEAVTERRATLEALHQSQKMEAVGQLAGGIAHDFNNLLTGIVGSLELMQRRLAQGRLEAVERYVTAAMTSANRAAGLTHRLLTFAQRRPLEAKVTDLNRTVASIEDLLRRTISERIDLQMALAGGVWRLSCDPNQLESAILNLAINARDAMPDGGRLTVETGNASLDAEAAKQWDVAPGSYVFVAVKDTGAGMPPDVVERAFEPFFTTKPLGVGTGLGLPMTFSFARQSGGCVRIESVVGEGTAVTIYLPRTLEDESPIAAAPPGPRVHPSGEGRVVLVVEDEQAVRSLVMEVLQEHGYRGISATDGASALEVLTSGAQVDLLITDVGLPGLDGPKLVEAALAHRPGLRVLFMTGYAHDVHLRPEACAASVDVIAKPFTLDGLLSQVRRSLPPIP